MAVERHAVHSDYLRNYRAYHLIALDVDDYMEIGYITHSKAGTGRFGSLYIEALKRYASSDER